MLNRNATIEQICAIGPVLQELAELLVKVVEDGASIGFLPPLSLEDASVYWRQAAGPDVILYVVRLDARMVGTVQLQLCSKQNGAHRAEIAKLMTHPNARRQGIGRALMLEAEARAKREGRTLLVLDTREGDPSNLLYKSLDYLEAGRIPDFAKSANGELHATVLYYKRVD
ncbi:GCN5-related N-acetyltransferase [Paenibacillus curdlanolyticus YK9]|uniref:GCN5-related N-acetyltransferase n=1 Tax=Paenibacillus curdlanolyticus YK9 TaxID=717606 RepID=E0ID18_9BACL|nr:GNAT family N-acetyltransferase [Paenibacillus curdlanolyticus]EFM09473.1 GCN5-related N-acetyltransferase [Paenibacillus curdlanolyticus YK9]